MPDGSAPSALSRPAVLRARLIVSSLFFLNGFLFANWVPRIPEKRDALGMSEGVLGLALLAMALGAFAAVRATGPLVDRFGARRPVAAFAAASGVALVGVGLAGTPLALGLALFVFGVAQAATDVAMNVEGAAVERDLGRPIFSGLHGLYSVGAMIGAGAGALAAEAGLSPTAQFLPLAALAAGFALWALRALPADRAAPSGPEPSPEEAARARARVRILGAIAFVALLAEGAAADWSAILLTDAQAASPGLAGAAFAAFSATMALGRFAGDRAQAAFGRARVIAGGGALALAGLAAALAAPGAAAAVAGFAAMGLGLSCLFPAALLAAVAAAGPRAAGAAIGAVAGWGYFGFIVGPPLIGFGAEAVGLTAALAAVAALLLLPIGAARAAR